MDDSGTVRARNTAENGNQNANRRELMTTKPLHRFVQKEPKSLGIVILIFGCAEVLMGFQLASESLKTSSYIYIPFWQGALFLICGNLSIYTGIHPSKKMVTVCLAMYVVSILGIIVSVGYRISTLASGYFYYGRGWRSHDEWSHVRVEILVTIEALLMTCSLCVSVLLIFLCAVARLALKSTHTQIVVHQMPPPVAGTQTD